MKTAKLELNAQDAVILYKGLAAHENALAAEFRENKHDTNVLLSLAAVSKLKDKVSFIFERTRPNPPRKTKV